MNVRLFLGVFAALSALNADGGAIQWQRTSGAYKVTLFAAPTPLRAGPVDLSVLLQTMPDGAPVTDASVVLRWERSGDSVRTLAANHEVATNKILYATEAVLPAGVGKLKVVAQTAGREVQVDGPLLILDGDRTFHSYWPYFAAVPACVLLFMLNRWLAYRGRTGSRA